MTRILCTTARNVRNAARGDKWALPGTLWTSGPPGLTHSLMASKPSKKASSAFKQADVVLVYGQSEDGKEYGVLRQRGSEIEAGRMRPLDEGKPIHGEVVRLRPREESPVLFDVEVQHDARPSTGRPAKVATEEYRRGWESIWAKKPGTHSLN